MTSGLASVGWNLPDTVVLYWFLLLKATKRKQTCFLCRHFLFLPNNFSSPAYLLDIDWFADLLLIWIEDLAYNFSFKGLNSLRRIQWILFKWFLVYFIGFRTTQGIFPQKHKFFPHVYIKSSDLQKSFINVLGNSTSRSPQKKKKNMTNKTTKRGKLYRKIKQ